MMRARPIRSGFSLLEVLLALTVFMFSFVVVSQMIRSAAQRGLTTKQLTKAALLCETKMNEIVAGVQPLQSVGRQQLDGAEPGWLYSVTIQQQAAGTTAATSQVSTGLSLVQVTVTWGGPKGSEPVEVTLSRMIIDPQMRVPAPSPTPSTTGS